MKGMLMLLLLLGGSAWGQEERITGGDRLLIHQVRTGQPAGLPTHGMEMSQVEAAHGAPISRAPAVGDPPITRWDYTDFAVYFENQTVIHTVQKPESSEAGS